MNQFAPPLEIHIHSQIPLRPDVEQAQLQDALAPLWRYAGARSLSDGAKSLYDEEPGIVFSASDRQLQLCWTVAGDDDIRQTLDEMCMNLNELCAQGAAIEVSVFDAQYNDEYGDEDSEDADEDDSKDDFFVLFVGPTPEAIMQVQRDLLVRDVVSMMERHFDGSELGGLVAEIDRLFAERFSALSNSLQMGRNFGGSGNGHGGGGRRPRHLH
jgi:hypothetical protein